MVLDPIARDIITLSPTPSNELERNLCCIQHLLPSWLIAFQSWQVRNQNWPPASLLYHWNGSMTMSMNLLHSCLPRNWPIVPSVVAYFDDVTLLNLYGPDSRPDNHLVLEDSRDAVAAMKISGQCLWFYRVFAWPYSMKFGISPDDINSQESHDPSHG